MARTPSNMVPIGMQAPDFELKNTLDGKVYTLDQLKSDKATLVIFMCNHCPFVIHILDELVKFAKEYSEKGLSIIAISSNDVENYPQDSPEKMAELAQKKEFNFPYLYDETQEVAKAYDAACTPDFYLFDANLKLSYRGQFDDSRPETTIPVTGKDLRDASDLVLEGKIVEFEQKPSIGCNIKWRN